MLPTRLGIVPSLALSLLAVVVGCVHSPPGAETARYAFVEIHMGMDVRLVVAGVDEAAARSAAARAFERIAELDAMLSDYRPDSEVSQLERRAGEWIPVSADLFRVLDHALAVARASGGAFDPTIGPVVRLWREARGSGREPPPEALAAAADNVGWQRVALDTARQAIRYSAPGTQFDLGGVAKGYVLQEALEVLRRSGAARSLVEAGGDIVVGDPPPGLPGWRIVTPLAGSGVAGRAGQLANAALATSGPTAQSFVVDGERRSHIVDPATGEALTSRWTATVIYENAALADALATALSVLGEDGVPVLAEHFPEAVFDVAPIPSHLP